MLHSWWKSLFVHWSVYYRKKKWRLTPWIIICMMKWVINGTQCDKMFKTPVICCVLTPSKLTFLLWNIYLGFFNIRNSNNETYQTLHMSFLNYLLIIKAKLGDLCIIIILISFSIFFIFYTMPNNWKMISQNNTFV